MDRISSVLFPPRQEGHHVIQQHFRTAVVRSASGFIEPTGTWEAAAKRIFDTQLTPKHSAQEAAVLARDVIKNYPDHAALYNAREGVSKVPAVLPRRVIRFGSEVAVEELHQYVADSEHDLDSFLRRLHAEEKRYASEGRLAVLEARLYDAGSHVDFMDRLLEALDAHKKEFFKKAACPQALNALAAQEPHPASSLRHAAYDVLNALNPVSIFSGPYALRPSFRDLHPQFYVGERTRQGPLVAAANEFDRIYVLGGHVPNRDVRKVAYGIYGHRVTTLERMRNLYVHFRQDLSRRLDELKSDHRPA